MATDGSRLGRWLGWAARGVLLAWVAFWTWFNVASAVGEVGTDGAGALLHHLVLALLMLASVLLAWRRPRLGADALLLLAGLFAWLFRPGLPVSLLLLAPPVLAALLLIAADSLAPRRAT